MNARSPDRELGARTPGPPNRISSGPDRLQIISRDGRSSADTDINVAIIEDHPVTRIGLADVITKASGVTLVDAVSSVEQYDQLFNSHADVIVLDLDLGNVGVEGPEAVKHFRTKDIAVLVVSMYGEEMPVLEAISAGAHGYLTKDADPQEIIRAIKTVAAGDTYFSATVAGHLLRTPSRLTSRETQILRLVASGEKTADIAAQLFVTEKAINGHLERIRDKTGCRRRPDLTRLAYELGILSRRRRRHD